MIIIGIDPGTATTGFGIVEIKGKNKYKCIDYGVIKTSPKWTPQDRLQKINNDFNQLLKKYKPKVMAIESLFFFKNLKTAVPVSQARGIFLMAASKKNIQVHEFTPLQAKIATVGYGRAEKKQVQQMLKIIFNLEDIPKPDDASDALALAT